MTTICFEAKDGRYMLSAQGHATGSPEVCAAVSGLLYALAGYLINAEKEGNAAVLQVELESGRAVLHACVEEKGAAAFEMTIIGLQQIGVRWPKLVRVSLNESG